MQDSTTSVSPLALTGAISGVLVLIFSIIYLFFRSPSSSKTEEKEDKTDNRIKSENDGKKQTTKSTTSKPTKQDTKAAAAKFTHPWLCTSLRAHSSSINGLNFSHNDKFLASAAEGNFVIILLPNLCSIFIQMIVFLYGKRKTSTEKIISRLNFIS